MDVKKKMTDVLDEVMQKNKDILALEDHMKFLIDDIKSKNNYYMKHGWNDDQFVDLMKEVAVLENETQQHKALKNDIYNQEALLQMACNVVYKKGEI